MSYTDKMEMLNTIDKLYETQDAEDKELERLLMYLHVEDMDWEKSDKEPLCKDEQNVERQQMTGYLFEKARQVAKKHYSNKIYTRGLIEISNYCKNNCYYCGIRAGNKNVSRYRITKEEILACCDKGYEIGFRTFVLQGGEDSYYDDEVVCDIVSQIKENYPDCAVTLSLGERSRTSYEKMFKAGADRYLLRHETANPEHYRVLHPQNMSYDNRMECLKNLKDIGYQVGCGIMVGSPGQTIENLVKDLRFMKMFQPHMVGIGPFLSQKDTPFANKNNGSVEQTLCLLAIIRLMLPKVLLPATTALGTAAEDGREKGILAGANVVMPNLSPENVRDKYALYDNKLATGAEAAESLRILRDKIQAIGYELTVDRGDAKL